MVGERVGIHEQTYIRGALVNCLLGARLRTDRPTLGVCFGTQMMAAASCAHFYAGPVKEVGFHPVQLNKPDISHLLGV
jgi:GMP synthase (glutamine-hydrolysing)